LYCSFCKFTCCNSFRCSLFCVYWKFLMIFRMLFVMLIMLVEMNCLSS
jgi:hypothetical protein